MNLSRLGLQTYLQDHLAASVAAVDLMAHLLQSKPSKDEEAMLVQLKAEVEEDRTLVEEVLTAQGGASSHIKGAGAWVVEKISRVKLWTSKQETEALFWLQAYETLCLALRGKTALWRLLSAEGAPELPGTPKKSFEQRALRSERQEARVETARVKAGLAVMATGAAP